MFRIISRPFRPALLTQGIQEKRKALIVFMRYPETGKVKTRIAEHIGAEEACRVYQMLLRRTLGIVSEFKRQYPEVEVFLCLEPAEKIPEAELAYPGPWKVIPQEGMHLGNRMENAFVRLFSRGFEHILLVGSDILDLQVEDFEDAFQALGKSQAALGPAADGGFYLIGLDRPCPAAFEDQLWGLGEILLRTEQKLLHSGFQVVRLKTRRDVDRKSDLDAFYSSRDFRGKLSVIIPTLSGIDPLRTLLESLNAQLWPDDEIIVVQGNDEEGGDSSEMGPRVRTASSPRGRGIQMNRGAELAKGDILLFLHDDSHPPPQFPYLIRKIGNSPGISLGCFELGFKPSSRGLDWIARWANLRSRWFKLPYGDQGIFCKRSVYDRLGGFRRRFLMEDVDFVRRGKKLGKLMMMPCTLYTSPRRYLAKGILRTSIENHLMILLYALGIKDETLYSIYYRK